MAKSWRAQFAEVIHNTITANKERSLKETKEAIRAVWRTYPDYVRNDYPASIWSREVNRQLASHKENQKTTADLPLFNQEN